MLDRSHELATTADSMSTGKSKTAFPGFDQRFHAAIARLTGGLSPLALSQAYVDWAGHLLMSPDKQAELTRSAAAASVLLSERGAGHRLPPMHRTAAPGQAV